MSPQKQLSGGFTLIELMIVVAIIAILASIAYPSYQEQVRQSRRAEAQAVLLEAAQFMERFFTVNSRYHETTGGDDVALPAALAHSPKDGGTARYNVALSAVDATSFTLQATPVGSDPGCGVLTLNQAGVKPASGTLGTDGCWRR